MLYEIAYEFRLWRLQTRQRSVDNANNRQLRVLRRPPQDRDSIGAAEFQASFDHQEFEGAIDELQSQYIVHQIRKYRLAYPESADWEEEEAPFYYKRLKRHAIMRLQRDIRLEQKERWERWHRWLPILTAITGVLGAVIGVVSTFK